MYILFAIFASMVFGINIYIVLYLGHELNGWWLWHGCDNEMALYRDASLRPKFVFIGKILPLQGLS